MALIGWTFFKAASGGLLSMLSYKYFKEPPGIDCTVLLDNYSETLEQMAYNEARTLQFENQFQTILPLNLMSRQGYMSCFCRSQKFSPQHQYKVKDVDGSLVEYKICERFDHKWWRIWESEYYLTSLSIVIWNIILRAIYKTFIKGIRYTSKAVEDTAIMLSLFDAFFSNYGLLYLLAPTTKSYAQITDVTG